MARIELSGLCKFFGLVEVLKDIDLTIEDREFAVFVGPSGCGKTTLLRVIAGLERASAGDILIDGTRVNDVAPAGRGGAMVFQSYALYPHKSVFENMAFSLRIAKRARAEIAQRVGQAAEKLQITHLLERKPKALSGGQRQRVAIGRAIVREPKVFLFDEPLSNLDAALRGQMRLELARLHGELDSTMIYVTHDQVEAMTLADKIVVLREGRIEQVGSPRALYENPANRFVAGFLGAPQMNFLPVTLDGSATGEVVLPNGSRLDVPGWQRGASPPAELGVRPEHVHVEGNGALAQGIVAHSEYLGSSTFLHLDLVDAQSPARVVATASPRTRITQGERVPIAIAAEACRLFDAAGEALPA